MGGGVSSYIWNKCPQNLADDLSHEMEAMKNSVATMGAMHEKQIKANHVDNIFPEYLQGGLPVPVRLGRSAVRYLFGTQDPCISSASSSTP